jgi:methylated-DNA-protein-cysteine methyltransferase-like protein
MSSSFSSRVTELALAIPAGRVTTYGHLAKAAGGGAMAARSVSGILAKYPNKAAIPWHRIVYAGGKVWWDDAHKAKRKKYYAAEGIVLTKSGKIQDFAEILWDPRELT